MNEKTRFATMPEKRWARSACVAALACVAFSTAQAQLTDLASIPLTSVENNVKPNVMFILDDSGSMGRDYMPDEAGFSPSKYGRNASQCNGLAYNPNVDYKPPVDAAGSFLATGTYTFAPATDLNNVRGVSSPAAPTIATGSLTLTLASGSGSSYTSNMVVTVFSNDNQDLRMIGTVTSWNSSTKQLVLNVTETQGSGSLGNPRVGDGDNRPFYFTYPASGGQTPLSYTYTSSGVDTATQFYRECNSVIGATPGSAVFTKVVVTPFTITDSYRNWYTYYRTRMLMAKTAASQAFKPITDRFRVGFTTISSRTVDGSKFLDVADFDGTHKSNFYTTLFNQTTDSYTPLRGALSKAGKYYAKRGRLSNGNQQTYDPMEFSCQKNFAILTTDGYWNTNTEVNSTGADSYGPDKLDNTDVGQQDGNAPRSPAPMADGATSVTQERTSNLQQRTITPQWTTSTSTLQQRSVSGALTISTSNLQSRTMTLFAENSVNSGASWSTPIAVSSCTWDNTGPTRTRCSYAASGWSAWSNVGSCTPNALGTGTTGGTIWRTGVQCQYTAWTAPAPAASCTAQAQDLTPPHTVGVATQCTFPVYGAWANTSTCTASASNECRYNTPVNTTTTSCTAVAPSTGPNYTVAAAVQCTALPPLYSAWSNVSSCTATSTTGCQYSTWTPWTNVASCTATPQSTAPNYSVGMARECQTNTTGGSSNTLADVAMYYYNTDLRNPSLNNCTLANGTDVCEDNVRMVGDDTARHQRMATYTVGMGVNGLLRYASNYLSGGSADYNAIIQGGKDWPIPASGGEGPEAIDDLWHAAVNGRGRYFSSRDPSALARDLRDALLAIDAASGSGSGAASSTLQPIATDNSLYIAKYKTVEWTGDLVARAINPQTGEIAINDTWSAQQKLDARVASGTARTIFYMKRNAGANTGVLRDFTYTNLSNDGLLGNFADVCSKAIPLSQCTDTGYDVTGANAAANIVAWLRGGTDARYRSRVHVLGDIVGGAPVYVRKPSFQYTENGYAAFASAKAGRTGVVYVASNDGMLHAFDGTTGEEKWAYVPSMVMDRMYRLADNDYANRHIYLVNGAPVVGDIFVPGSPGTWKTILVGGLAGGGRGYYALDITDPEVPQPLWEFTNDSLGGDNNLGLSFGNPVITKRADGTWIVAFTSGYNNVSPGDGNGRLFVVNANTGARLKTIATEISTGVPAGTSSAPSGLGKLNAWVESTIDNSARRFYAGDLLGNLWRFDIDNLVQPNNAAHRLAYLRAGSPASAQPITTQPALGVVDYGGSTYPVVYVGTGRLLGSSDLGDTSVQSVYAIKDPLDATQLGDVHASSSMVAQTLSQTAANAPRTVTNNAVDWTTKNGWYVDLIGAGERVNVDMQVVLQTLTVASNMPNSGACLGSSYLYNFNLSTGSAPIGSADGRVGTWLGTTLVVGISYLTLQQGGSGEAGTGRTITVIVDNTGAATTAEVPPPPPPPAAGRRTSWRELAN